MNDKPNHLFLVPTEVEMDYEFSTEEKFELALESVYRWTLRRDELNDDQIVLAIKRVAVAALENV